MPTETKEKKDRGWIEVHKEECKGCGLCIEAAHGYHFGEYQGHGCTGCGVCFYACPEPGAIAVFKK